MKIQTKALHLVSEGTAVVVDNDPEHFEKLLYLRNGDMFGESYITKLVGPTYMGNVHAFLKPVKTFSFTYEALDKILTFPERAQLQSSEFITPALESCIQSMAVKKNIPVTKLR